MQRVPAGRACWNWASQVRSSFQTASNFAAAGLSHCRRAGAGSEGEPKATIGSSNLSVTCRISGAEPCGETLTIFAASAGQPTPPIMTAASADTALQYRIFFDVLCFIARPPSERCFSECLRF